MISGFLTALFAPILTLPAFIAELIIAIIIVFIATLFSKFIVNQSALRELKNEQKEKQEKLKELQKTNPKEAAQMMNDILRLTNKQLRMNIKPLILTLILAIIFLPWLAIVFTEPVVYLPFSLPFFENDFGWLAWYIIVSFPLNSLFRKFMGVEQ